MKENWQVQATRFAEKRNLKHDPEVHALDLMSELGEVAKELLLATDYGRHPANITTELAAELGDALYSLCLLATAMGIDLETAFIDTLKKYEQRWQAKGHPGSQTS